MLANLIEDGISLEAEAHDGMMGKFFESVSFEKWVSKSILYFENYFKDSVLTEKAKEGYKKLNQNNNYDYYKFLLGALKATKEFEENQEESN